MAQDPEMMAASEIDQLLEEARRSQGAPGTGGLDQEGVGAGGMSPAKDAIPGRAAGTSVEGAIAVQAAGLPPGSGTSLPGGARSASSAAGQAGSLESTADDIQFLLDQAEAAIRSVNQPSPPTEGLTAFPFRELMGSPASTERATLDALSDVELDLKIELGRTDMYLEDVLKLRRGSVVSLDKLAGDPVDVYVNGRLIARGEVLVLNDNFCVRVAELVAGDNVAT
jgi:flagellar motor switch protein FliN/FliY